jgi:predicted dehydrogenase
MAKPVVKIGLIGAGFIGRTHGLAVNAVNATFVDLPVRASAYILCDVDESRARAQAGAMGFAHATADWREAVDQSDAVIIAVPSRFHAEIARYAFSRSKAVLCEKPVGLSAAEATALAREAEAAGIVNAVGFTYLRAPMVAYAKQLLDSGALGKPIHFYGRHFEDYLASAETPFSWRLDKAAAGRCGALGDLGCHIIAVARYLCGSIASLSGARALVHEQRRTNAPDRPLRAVENEDYASAMLTFASGAPGFIEVSRVAHGRKMDLSFEVTCERGSIRLEAERLNEISVYLESEAASGLPGFKTILINPSHPAYGAFLPAPGHGLGFNDLKTIELAAFLRGVAAKKSTYPDIAEAARISGLCEAILDSAETRSWADNPETLAEKRI